MILRSHAKFEEKLTCGLENYTRNLANFHQSTWKCQNWEFNGIYFFKVENAWSKNLQRSYVSLYWRMMKKLKRNWLVISKLTWEIWRILTQASKVSEIFTLLGSFWTKYILLELKKYRGVIFYDTEEWCKIWKRKLTIIWQIFTARLKSLKIGTMMGSFYLK